MSSWVLQFQQADKPDQPILVHVTQKPGTTLDLDLLATDGEHAYKGKIRERSLPKLRAEHFDGTDEEWTAFLRHVFVYTQDSGLTEEQAKILEAYCAISGRRSQATLSITLRSRIEDITHRLGTIDLPFTDNTDDVELFGWAHKLAEQRDMFRNELALQKKEAEATTDTIKNLQQQLAELVEAKKDHEDQLLSKFELLINAKKLNIRNQQRILQTAKLDQKALDALHLTNDGGQTDGGPGKRKRRSDTGNTDKNQSDDNSEGFEPMDVDPKSESDNNQAEDPATPDRSETETESEDERPVRSKVVTKLKPPASRRKSRTSSPSMSPTSARETKTSANRKEQTTIDSGSETATEDDEL